MVKGKSGKSSKSLKMVWKWLYVLNFSLNWNFYLLDQIPKKDIPGLKEQNWSSALNSAYSNCSIMIQKVFETNSGFYVKQHTTEKAQFLFFRNFFLQPWAKYSRKTSCEIAHCKMILISTFQQFLASINKMFLLGGRLETRF